MRLIDADRLMGILEDGSGSVLEDALLDIIRCQPTAYNVDKVMERINELKKQCLDIFQDYDPEYFIDKSIEVVKSGGVE